MSHRRVYSGGSYPMLNPIVSVRYVRPYAKLDIIVALGGTAILQPFDRRNSISVVLLRSQERSSCPTEKFTSGGSYPMLNSIVSVRPPNWDLAHG